MKNFSHQLGIYKRYFHFNLMTQYFICIILYYYLSIQKLP